jgi:hypothetical protein
MNETPQPVPLHPYGHVTEAEAQGAVAKLAAASGPGEKLGINVDKRLGASSNDWAALQELFSAAVSAFAQGGTAVLVVRFPAGTNSKDPGYATIGFGERGPEDAAELLRGAAHVLFHPFVGGETAQGCAP